VDVLGIIITVCGGLSQSLKFFVGVYNAGGESQS